MMKGNNMKEYEDSIEDVIRYASDHKEKIRSISISIIWEDGTQSLIKKPKTIAELSSMKDYLAFQINKIFKENEVE